MSGEGLYWQSITICRRIAMKVEPIKTAVYDLLSVAIYESNEAMGLAAALGAREVIQKAISDKGEANIILATGNSQLTFLHALCDMEGIDWAKVNVFHLDEYVGIDSHHTASFPLFLRQHIVDAVRPGAFYPMPGQAKDLEKVCQDYETLLREHPADLVALGFGENGHLAFNDPPYARFDDPVWVKVVELAEASRRQQVGEGHFSSLEQVPTHAVTLTIPALLAPRVVLCIVPETRKAEAVRACLRDPISEDHPGSILRQVEHARLYLDRDSASKL
jgi:glucosamine-6-phosphate deaminase